MAPAAPAQWESHGLGAGGAQYAPAISPFDSREIYVSCDMSEVFHTTNGGLAWETVDFRQLQGGRLCQVQFTSQPEVRYAVNYRRSRFAPSISTNGGSDWILLSTNAWPTNRACFALWADPTSSHRLLAAAQTSLYVSLDRGASFQLVTNFPGSGAPPGSFQGLRLGGAFSDGTSIFAAYNRGLLVSTNGGTSFVASAATGLPAGESLIGLAGARAGATTRLFCVTALTNAVYPDPVGMPYGACRGLYSLDEGSTSWVSRLAGLPTNETYALVALCPTNIHTVYLAGRSTNYPNARIYKSLDGGATWGSVLHISTNVVSGWAGLPAVSKVNWGQTAGLAVDPRDPDHVVITDNGFTHLTTNGGAIWQQAYLDPATQNPPNTANPQAKSYRGIGFEPTVPVWLAWIDATNLLAGFSDLGLTRSHDAGQSWNFDHSGLTNDEVYHIVVHPTSGAVYADNQGATSPYMILGLDDASTDRRFGPLMVSTNGGQAWTALKHWLAAPVWEEMDPGDPETMYVSLMNSSNGGIQVTHNLSAGTNALWTDLGRHARANGRAYNIRVLHDGTLVTTFSCRQLANGAFEPSSGVYVWNGGWLDRSASNFWYWTQDVVIDPWDSGQSNWYVAVWNAGSTGAPDPATQGGLYRTTDRGLTWSALWTNGSAQSVTFSPVNSNELWLTTSELGLWHSRDIRQATPTFRQDTNYPFRHPFRAFYNPHRSNELWLTSNGNGLRVGCYSNWTVVTAPTTHGAISPAGPSSIYDGMPAAFAVTADPYYHVLEVTTNGGPAGPVTQLVWNAVDADTLLAATFAENLADHATPHWWLAAHGLATSDAAAGADVDMDGFAAWQEFAAGTTPTDAASFFQALDIAPAESPGVGIVVSWSGRADRVYDVLRSTNALYAPGPLAAGLAGAHSWTDQTPRDLATYRVQVQGP